MYVNLDDKISAVFGNGNDLSLYEEVTAENILPVNLSSTFTDSQIRNGDILIVQKILAAANESFAYPNVILYFQYLSALVGVAFKPKEDGSESDEFSLNLDSRLSVESVSVLWLHCFPNICML